MSQPQWARTDDDLLAALRGALTAEPAVSDRVSLAAKASFAWRSVDQDLELLLLVEDSAQQRTAGVRSASGSDLRLLEFHSTELNLELEVSPGFVMGQLIPMQSGHITLSTAEGTFAETDADGTGSFRLPRPVSGPVRMVCQTDSAQLATEWTRL
jgi:hypothetical protein